MTARLRELAERWNAANRTGTLYVAGKTVGMHDCARELITILDEEGDGGVSDADVKDAARYRWLRKRVGVSASYGFTNAYIPCGNSKITEADADLTDQIIDAAIKGERHE